MILSVLQQQLKQNYYIFAERESRGKASWFSFSRMCVEMCVFWVYHLNFHWTISILQWTWNFDRKFDKRCFDVFGIVDSTIMEGGGSISQWKSNISNQKNWIFFNIIISKDFILSCKDLLNWCNFIFKKSRNTRHTQLTFNFLLKFCWSVSRKFINLFPKRLFLTFCWNFKLVSSLN